MNYHASQRGRLSRRALLILAGATATGAGVLVGLRHGIRSAETSSEAGNLASNPGSSTAPAAADTPLITGDLVGTAFWQQQFDRPHAEGGQAPAPLKLSAARGHPVLVNFWATWCPPCVKEMPELERFHKAFAPKGWQVVGLAIDGPTPVREFLAKVGVGFDIGLAGFGGTELAQALGNTSGGLPFSVLIDAQGRVKHRKMGATSFEELASWARHMTA